MDPDPLHSPSAQPLAPVFQCLGFFDKINFFFFWRLAGHWNGEGAECLDSPDWEFRARWGRGEKDGFFFWLWGIQQGKMGHLVLSWLGKGSLLVFGD